MPGGRPADTARYKMVLGWLQAGKTYRWIGEQCGLKNPHALIFRARRWAQGANKPRPTLLRAIDEVITDGLKVQSGVVVDALSEVRDALRGLHDRVAALEAAEAKTGKKVDALSNLPASVPEPKPDRQALAPFVYSATPPASFWTWVVNECCRQIGKAAVAEHLEVEVTQLERWASGNHVPSSRQREDLKVLLATIWGRELFDDVDDLEDARARLPQTRYAEVM